MCGINGLLSDRAPAEALASRVRAMNAVLRHRGPDGERCWTGDGVALGHRRLSIIDLSERASQPMSSPDGRLVLVCNGEIYNFRELRREFPDYPFVSETDVEVILPLYERYGERCVDHLVGMFAFALWDGTRRRLMLARDRIGEKPLYYAADGGTLAFSSEMKALLTLPWVDRGIDEAAVPFLMVYSSLPAPGTIYAGIRLLPPASYMLWQQGRRTVERYWRLDFSRRRAWRWNDALAAYGDVLGNAVQSSLVADVPLGLMLSGGVDSSTIAALAMHQGGRIESFCLGADRDDRLDREFASAARAAALLGTQHSNIRYELPGLRDLPAILGHYDQPMSCMAALFVDRLAEVMRRRLAVVLSGNGGDEVFGGYRTYAGVVLRGALEGCAPRIPRGINGALPEAWRDRAEQFIVSSRHPIAARRGVTFSMLADARLARLATPAFARRWIGSDAGRPVVEASAECNPGSLLDATIYSDLMVYHQHGHAVIPDMAGMRHGLEIRSPFLNHKVVEFAATLPRAMLIPSALRASRTKEIAKRWLAAHLPRSFVYQRKVGFGETLEIERHFRLTWAAAIAELLLGGRYLELGIFARSGAQWALGHSYEATAILLSFAVWAELALFGETVQSLGDRLMRAGAAPDR